MDNRKLGNDGSFVFESDDRAATIMLTPAQLAYFGFQLLRDAVHLQPDLLQKAVQTILFMMDQQPGAEPRQ